jgi:hypothetical protein
MKTLVNGEVMVNEEAQTLTAVISYDCLSEEIKDYLNNFYRLRSIDLEDYNTKITVTACNIFDKDLLFFGFEVEFYDDNYGGDMCGDYAIEYVKPSDTESEKILQAMKKSITKALAKI